MLGRLSKTVCGTWWRTEPRGMEGSGRGRAIRLHMEMQREQEVYRCPGGRDPRHCNPTRQAWRSPLPRRAEAVFHIFPIDPQRPSPPPPPPPPWISCEGRNR